MALYEFRIIIIIIIIIISSSSSTSSSINEYSSRKLLVSGSPRRTWRDRQCENDNRT